MRSGVTVEALESLLDIFEVFVLSLNENMIFSRTCCCGIFDNKLVKLIFSYRQNWSFIYSYLLKLNIIHFMLNVWEPISYHLMERTFGQERIKRPMNDAVNALKLVSRKWENIQRKVYPSYIFRDHPHWYFGPLQFWL